MIYKYPPAVWRSVDWSLTDKQIASKIGCTPARVWLEREKLGLPKVHKIGIPASIWSKFSGAQMRYYNARTPDEAFIMQQYREDELRLAKTDDCAHWDKYREALYATHKNGIALIAEYKKRKSSRARREAINQRRAKDPEFDAKVRQQMRQKWSQRTLTPEQKQRRAERYRHLYHTRDKHDPRWRAEHNLRVRLKKFLGGHKSLTMRTLLGCSKDTLVKHLEKQFQKGMNWKNYGRIWQIDHVTPCAEFDLTKTDEQRKCFHFSNLRPLWAEDNNRKGKKIVTHQPELIFSLDAA